MKRLWISLALVLFLVPAGGEARRLPSTLSQGEVRVVATDKEWKDIVDLHTGVVFLELRSRASSSQWRPRNDGVAGIVGPGQGWNSTLIARLERQEDSIRWTGSLREHLSGDFLEGTFLPALRNCLNEPDGSSWPARVLSQAAVEVAVQRGPAANDFQVVFSSPVGVLPQLLSGCRLAPGSNEAAYVLRDGVLEARLDSRAGRTPLISRIRRERGAENADIQVDGPITGKRGSQLGGFSDVVLLLSPSPSDSPDPLGLSNLSAEQRGLRLASGPLLAAIHQGRGRVADRLLPEGVAIGAPTVPESETSPPPLGASLPSPSDGNWTEVLKLSWPSDDELLVQLAERLALLASEARVRCTYAEGGYRLLRFLPQSHDAGLALLELAQASPTLAAAAGERIRDPRLLSADPTERVAAALELERRWLDSGLVLPLLTTQHWLALQSELREVHLHPSGVPSLHQAWTSSASGGPR